MANTPDPEFLYRIVPAAEWSAAVHDGTYRGSDHDRADGFIHLSTATQVPGTLAAHYAGVADLVLLRIARNRLPLGTLRWEPSRDGALFPHLYADLPCRAVFAVERLALDRNRRHVLPPGISTAGAPGGDGPPEH